MSPSFSVHKPSIKHWYYIPVVVKQIVVDVTEAVRVIWGEEARVNLVKHLSQFSIFVVIILPIVPRTWTSTV